MSCPRLALPLAAALLACGGSTPSPSPPAAPSPGGGATSLPTGDACLGAGLLDALGRSHLLVGLSGDEASADAAPYDLRYQYISGGIAPGAGPCTSCAQASCRAWWGCWQDWNAAPGQFVEGFVATAQSAAGGAQVPMFTYYQLLQSMSPPQEGRPEVAQVADRAFVSRYLADFRLLLEKIGTAQALVHLEPDFWGYAAQLSAATGVECSGIPAAVATAAPAECAGLPETLAGLGRCMIRMVRRHAPQAKVGLHASGWGTNFDVLMNRDPAFDVAGHARQLGEFLAGCGAGEGDFVAADMNDVDAGTNGKWWDATNATLPSFHQAFQWARIVAETVGRPILWWQTPVGDMGLANPAARDNRLDYAFDHMDELAASHAVGIAFGAGAAGISDPGNDGGHLARRATAHAAAGGQPLCGP
ncbi:MAG TPA: hypothetical protein VFP65_00400 [Anaeromyxobacteraceae bacterium]|nr:hypothetical protein [Anaeromyxobacteraceae bacterium]